MKKISSIFLSFFLAFILFFSNTSIECFASESTEIPSDAIVLYSSFFIDLTECDVYHPLYLSDGTQITVGYLKEHPELSLTMFCPNSGSKFSIRTYDGSTYKYGAKFYNVSYEYTGENIVFDFNSKPTTGSSLSVSNSGTGIFARDTDYVFLGTVASSEVWSCYASGLPTSDSGGSGSEVPPTDGSGGSEDDSSILDWIGNFFSNLFQNVFDFFGGLFQNLYDFFSGLFQNLYNFFSNLFKGFFDTVTSFYESFQQAIEEEKASEQRFDDVGTSIFSPLKNFILNLANVTYQPIYDFFNSISFESIDTFTAIFRLPVISDLLIGVVGLSVISGLFILFTTF